MLKNYSKCPLKKRPVYFTFDDSDIKDEPENLCIKKELSDNNNNNHKISSPQIIIKKEFNDTSEKQKLNIINDEYDEKISSSSSSLTSLSSSSVIIPTPTYPNLNTQSWNFHLPYSTDFYRSITNNNQHHQQSNHNNNYHHHYSNHQQISPLRGDLHSPSSPSEGSMSPPPHYLHGRGNSVSPPIYELYSSSHNNHHLSINGKQQNSHIIKPEVIPSHRFMPYQVPYQPYVLNLNNHHHHHHNHQHQQPPISPTYSEASSYYSIRSQTPESNCSVTPEDLSIKQLSSPTSSSSSSSLSSSSQISSNFSKHDNSSTNKSVMDIKEKITPPRYQCSDCNKSYSTFSGLTKHQQFHCPAAEGNQIKKSFSCKDCDKTYVSLGALKMHIRTHTLPCKCTICGKAFSRPWLLQGHIRTHTGEKPFSCQHCHRAFADRSNLRAHLQTHSDIKKYSCTTCSKTFSRMSLLTKHNEGGCPGVNGSGSPPYITSFQEH